MAAAETELQQAAVTLVHAISAALAPVCLALKQLADAAQPVKSASRALALLQAAASHMLPSVQVVHSAAIQAWQQCIAQGAIVGQDGLPEADGSACELLLQV